MYYSPTKLRKLYQAYSCHKVSSILPKLLRKNATKRAAIPQFGIPFQSARGIFNVNRPAGRSRDEDRLEKDGGSFKFHLRFNLRADM